MKIYPLQSTVVESSTVLWKIRKKERLVTPIYYIFKVSMWIHFHLYKVIKCLPKTGISPLEWEEMLLFYN